jgi:hypothetical protein
MYLISALTARLSGKTGSAGRDVFVRPDDIFITSYPKSGNTWLRFLIANLIAQKPEPIEFSEIETYVPDIYKNPAYVLDALSNPRYLKSHEYFDPRYPRVIYIVRDPRDVAVSYYYYKLKKRAFDETFPIDDFVESWLNDRTDPIGTWRENVGSWLGACLDSDRFFLLRYEDLLEDPVQYTRQLTSFMGLNLPDSKLAEAIDRSSSDTMRNIEKKDPTAFKAVSKGRTDIPFIRSAKAGGWREALSDSSVRQIEETCGPLMNRLGYLDKS